jgi:SAM-dependent methyltransferase
MRIGRQFGECAEVYDRVRPGYPRDLFARLAAYVPAGGTVVEVGAGTGIATRELLRQGWSVIAVEPDTQMAARLRAGVVGDVKVIESDFEHARLARSAADAILAAQSWHWVDRWRGLRRARRALRDGGVLGCWWNVGSIAEGNTAACLQQVFARRARPVPALIGSVAIDHAIERLVADLRLDRRFEAPERWTFSFARTYPAEELVALMSTMSQVVALPGADRARLLEELATGLDCTAVELRYRTELVVARRR